MVIVIHLLSVSPIFIDSLIHEDGSLLDYLSIVFDDSHFLFNLILFLSYTIKKYLAYISIILHNIHSIIEFKFAGHFHLFTLCIKLILY